MLIHSASELLTLAGGPQRGATLGTLGIIQDGAVLIRDGRIAAVGGSARIAEARTRTSQCWTPAATW